MAPDPNAGSKIQASSSLLDTENSSLPTNTRNALLSYLQDSTTIPRLNSLLTDSLARAGWSEKVHALSLELLRSGQCTSLGDVLEEVSRRACQGLGAANGVANGEVSGDNSQSIDVRIPKETIERSVRFLRDEIEGVVEVVHDEKNGGSAVNGVNWNKAI